jgi:hypothetical protein
MLGKRAPVKNKDQPAQKEAAGRNGGRASARKRS